MRLHRLELSAFGPFPNAVRIDLDALGADGLFLLHGETGAGKTTLLDAVAFALYGRVPGARGEAKRLRCDRADAATPTYVTLELTVAERRMEIIRTPEYLRPKSRGTGTTKAKASVSLRWLGSPLPGASSANLTRAEEVGQVVLDLLGMSADQFFQVVLLPQGEFARFLRADTAEREVLLERLFDTGRFARLEEWFAEQRKIAKAALDAADGIVAQELARVVEAAGLADQVAPVDADPDAAWLSALRTELRCDRDRAVATAAEARAARDSAVEGLANGRRRDAAVAKLMALRTEQADLEAGACANADLVAALDAAERALPAAAANLEVIAALQAESDAAQAVRSARLQVPEQFRPELGVAGTHALDLDSGLFSLEEDGSPHVPDADADVLHAAVDEVRDRAGSLGALVDLAAQQQQDVARREQLRARQLAAETELGDLQGELGHLPGLQAEADRRLAATRMHVAARPGRDAAVAAAAAVARAAAELPQRTGGLDEARGVLRSAIDEHQRARDSRQLLVERRIAGMAAELAEQLVDGAPCGVCGSVTHPSPARRTAEPVGANAVAAARDAEAARERDRLEAESAVAAAQAALVAATTAAAGRDARTAASELDRALAAQRESVEAAEIEPAQAESVRLLAVRAGELGDLRTSMLTGLEAVRTDLQSLDAAIGRRGEQLADATGDFESVADRRDHLLAMAALLDRWAATAEAHARASAATRLAVQKRDKAMADAGFADVTAAVAAADMDRAAAQDRIRRYQEEVLVVSTRLADPELDLPGPLQRVDLAALEECAASESRRFDQAAAASHHAARRCERVTATTARLEQSWIERGPLVTAAERATALADVIAGRGQNAKALSLRSYVLAAKLQQVAAVAGQRLARMSGGRYSFVHSDERESRGRSGGLGLDVVDGYSGKVRPAKTLSGGESFLASLALALGLADVVAAESGGRMLDTIFIDEGFGSLDSDTLDLVMATLDELRASGRVVGVVSHVDEMRQRIPTRLRVRKTLLGSAVELTAAGSSRDV